MTRLLPLLAVLSLSANVLSVNAQQFHVGKTNRQIRPLEVRNWRGAKTQVLMTDIWYPVDTSLPEKPQLIGPPGAPIFYGHPIVEGAPLSHISIRYPLILLSHGTGGSADSLDWLAAALAAHGFIVVGVNHPGNNALEPYTSAGFNLWWERAHDLSDALDAVLQDKQFGPHIAQNRIGAAGFSLGGYTVLELAGARTNRGALLRFCNSKEADATCHPPEMQQIRNMDATDIDDADANKSISHAADSYRDDRVRAVFAIAPALGEAFDSSDLKDIHIPIRIIAGGSDTTVPPDTNAKRFTTLQPSIRLEILSGGVTHYTFLDSCLPDKDLSLSFCKDLPGVNREKVHSDVGAEAVQFFTTQLKP